MGSSISKIYDDYDDYEYICKLNSIEPKNLSSGFYDHETSVLVSLGFKSKYDYFENLRKSEKRDKKIDQILL